MPVDFAATVRGPGLANIVQRGEPGTRGYAKDVNGFWQEAFDAARVVPQEQPSPEAGRRTGHRTGELHRLQIEATHPSETPAVAQQSVPGYAQPQPRHTLAGQAESIVPHPSLRTSVRASAAHPVHVPSTAPWAPLPDEAPQTVPISHATRLWHVASAAEAVPAEFVSVHMTAEGIELRVRSLDLDAPEAIRYAREVAKHLAGSTSQLRLLVLNGAIAYAGSTPAAPVDDTTQAGLLNIRC